HDKIVTWNLRNNVLAKSFEGSKPDEGAALLLRDNARLAFVTNDSSVTVVDVETGEQLACLQGHEYRINVLVEAFEGTMLVTGSSDCMLKLWDLSTYAPVASFQFDSAVVSCVAAESEKKLVVGDAVGGLHVLEFIRA